jgi:hypothetical protein
VASREEAQVVFARALMEKIRQDEHPSTTQMTLLEQMIPRELLDEYFTILLEKVLKDPAPSIPMLHRLNRVTAML